MTYSDQEINDIIDQHEYERTHKIKAINSHLKLYLKQTDNIITIERNWVIEYKQEYARWWLYWNDAADSAFRVMSIHY